MMIDFRIDSFLAVCRHLSFTKAAEQLHITQPAISQHIHALETAYGTKLFAFQGKKMTLTEAGLLLYQVSTTMKQDALHLKETIANTAFKRRRLSFGVTLTVGEFVIADRLKAYLDLYPDAEIQMIVSNTSDLLEKLGLGEIDFAIIEGNFSKEAYEHLLFSQERFIPVCSQTYPFLKKPTTLADLLSERLLIRESGSGTREILEKNLDAKNMTIKDFKHIVEIGGINAIKSMVAAGCGVSFLYEAAVKEELSSQCMMEIPLEVFRVIHDFSFIWLKGSCFSEEYRDIYRLLKA